MVDRWRWSYGFFLHIPPNALETHGGALGPTCASDRNPPCTAKFAPPAAFIGTKVDKRAALETTGRYEALP